ncbi:tyrosine-type recombinase/integrase [Francisella sciaenopsi]|uniref:Tyrosine-type recombinase/integrase n=1 Tax=Francisella sciaenopsi TaxID=3055034 RepID=A0ABQ6PC68_9GAMM
MTITKEKLTPKKITKDEHIEDLKAEDKEYKRSIGDGLYLRVDINGKKTWQSRYTIDKKRKWFCHGSFDNIKIDDAKIKNLELKKKIASGEDLEVKTEKPVKITVADMAREYILFQESNNRTPDFIKKMTNVINNHIIPQIGNRSVKSVKRKDCIELLWLLADKGATRKKTLSALKGIFRTAIYKDLIEHSPANELSDALPKYQAKPMSHISPLHNKKQLKELLIDLDNYDKGTTVIKHALMLLPYIVLRPKEIVSLKWDQYDADKARIIIPAEVMKMRKDHIVCLSKQAKQILENLRSESYDSEYIFPSFYRDRTGHISYESLGKAIRLMGYNGIDKPKQTLHGFRHIYSTAIHELQEQHHFSELAIELVLAHSDKNRSRASYNFADKLGERAKIMQVYADWIDNLKNS